MSARIDLVSQSSVGYQLYGSEASSSRDNGFDCLAGGVLDEVCRDVS